MRSPVLRSSLVFGAFCSLCAAAFAAALMFGARAIPAETVWQAFSAFDASDAEHGIVRGLRMQRALSGAACGAALAAAGVIMQGLTRNPLADPGLMGVNAGAALAVVAVLWGLGPQSTPAVAAAGVAAAAVWRLAGGRETAASQALMVRLPLAGTAISSLCLALVSAVVLLNTETRDLYRFWMAGSLGQATFNSLARLLPLICAGAVLALAAAPGVDSLLLGSDVAAGLGTRPERAAAAGLAAVTLLSGGAVALAGPVGFVGLIIPHATRAAGLRSTAAAVLAAMPLGAAFVLGCDTLGRIAARPSEIAIGLVLAVIGGPAFMILLSRILGPAE